MAADHRAKDAAMQKVRKRNLMFSAIRRTAKIADVLQDRITSLESANAAPRTDVPRSTPPREAEDKPLYAKIDLE